MKDLLFFNRFITPSIITFIYWLSIIGFVCGGIFTIFAGQILYGLVGIVLGVLGARIYCEIMMVIFKNNEYLRKISEKQ